jgi:hypothetical protein
MAKVYGNKIEKTELLKRVGSMAQIAGAREVILQGGKGEGVKAVEVYNDMGLAFTVLPGKGMEIGHASFCGKAISWDCKNGVVGPAYFENGGTGFYRSFSGGLLTACGLLNVGEGLTEKENVYGLHDRSGNIPAERYTVEESWKDGDFVISVKGRMRQSSLYGENLTLTREIVCKLGEPKIWINDVIRNEGFNETEYMFMYHMNFGYPLLSEVSRLYSPALAVQGINEKVLQGDGKYDSFTEPQKGYAFECFAHNMPKKERISVALVNPEMAFGVYIAYSSKELPTFNTWKMMGEQDYVLGLEPGINLPEGRLEARKNGRLRVLNPQEEFRCRLEIGVLPDKRKIDSFLKDNF